LKKTALHDFHAIEGHLAEYAGFDMPLWYKGAVLEHLSVRNNVGLFDVSHMGRLILYGEEVIDFLEYVSTNKCGDLDRLKSRHSFLCNPYGGVIDDLMLYRLDQNKFLLIVNAANTDKDMEWLENNATDFDVEIEDVTIETAMISIQGLNAVEVLQRMTVSDLSLIRHSYSSWMTLDGKKTLVSKTGYSGEDGFEIFLLEGNAIENVKTLWNKILNFGRDLGIEPCGLAARDTLRLEAGLCLNGNELTGDTTPVEAGLVTGINLDHNFIGREAIVKQLTEGVVKTLIGFRMVGRGIPRKDMDIILDERIVGNVTSGTFSPLLKIGIGLGYVSPRYSEQGTKINVKVRKRVINGEVVNMPFYSRKRGRVIYMGKKYSLQQANKMIPNLKV
jgi:aminomethyltransferase